MFLPLLLLKLSEHRRVLSPQVLLLNELLLMSAGRGDIA